MKKKETWTTEMVPPAGCIRTKPCYLPFIQTPRCLASPWQQLCNWQICNIYIGGIKGRERKDTFRNSNWVNVSPAGVTWWLKVPISSPPSGSHHSEQQSPWRCSTGGSRQTNISPSHGSITKESHSVLIKNIKFQNTKNNILSNLYS